MLAPINSFLCPISFEIATNPVYLKDCFHAFDRDSITDWIQKQMTGENNIVDCPNCRREYTLIVPEDQDRNLAIDDLCRDILRPLVVPVEVNEIVELMLARIQKEPKIEGVASPVQELKEPTIEAVASAVQELIAEHLKLGKENKELSTEVQDLSDKNVLLNSQILQEKSKHREKIANLRTQHEEKLTNLHTQHEEKLTNLHIMYVEKITKLNTENKDEMTNLRTQHEEKLTNLHTKHTEEIDNLHKMHEEKTTYLNSKHRTEISQIITRLNSEHRTEIDKKNKEHRTEIDKLMKNHQMNMQWSCLVTGMLGAGAGIIGVGATVTAGALFGPLRGMVRPLVSIAASKASETLDTTLKSARGL